MHRNRAPMSTIQMSCILFIDPELFKCSPIHFFSVYGKRTLLSHLFARAKSSAFLKLSSILKAKLFAVLVLIIAWVYDTSMNSLYVKLKRIDSLSAQCELSSKLFTCAIWFPSFLNSEHFWYNPSGYV